MNQPSNQVHSEPPPSGLAEHKEGAPEILKLPIPKQSSWSGRIFLMLAIAFAFHRPEPFIKPAEHAVVDTLENAWACGRVEQFQLSKLAGKSQDYVSINESVTSCFGGSNGHAWGSKVHAALP
jgi:hypothetical protein